nr:RHS repeat-associated core domain-containing protein [Akkermansia muciniphila]
MCRRCSTHRETIAAAYDYSPYGAVTGTGSLGQPVQWSGEMHDEEPTLVYYNYRFYNPKDGRWINRDPIAEQGGVKFILLFNQLSSINRLFGIIIIGAIYN